MSIKFAEELVILLIFISTFIVVLSWAVYECRRQLKECKRNREKRMQIYTEMLNVQGNTDNQFMSGLLDEEWRDFQ